LLGGIYMDEFAESHLKDLHVREALGAGLPLAGVGIACTRRFATRVFAKTGSFLNEASLTEDYELGLRAGRLGARAVFLSCYRWENGKRDWIATREFFPNRLRASVRQKTRWTLGIAFQGWENLRWFGGFWERFFLYRDRKGPLVNLVVLGGTVYFFLWLTVIYLDLRQSMPADWMIWTASATGGLMLNRLFQRAWATNKLYGAKALLMLPFRVVASNFVNALASLGAIQGFVRAKLTRRSPVWVKTEHEVPVNF
jgi:adsorption protein B